MDETSLGLKAEVTANDAFQASCHLFLTMLQKMRHEVIRREVLQFVTASVLMDDLFLFAFFIGDMDDGSNHCPRVVVENLLEFVVHLLEGRVFFAVL